MSNIYTARQQQQDARRAYREAAKTIGIVESDVELSVKENAHVEVSADGDGAFVEAVLWIPSALLTKKEEPVTMTQPDIWHCPYCPEWTLKDSPTWASRAVNHLKLCPDRRNAEAANDPRISFDDLAQHASAEIQKANQQNLEQTHARNISLSTSIQVSDYDWWISQLEYFYNTRQCRFSAEEIAQLVQVMKDYKRLHP